MEENSILLPLAPTLYVSERQLDIILMPVVGRVDKQIELEGGEGDSMKFVLTDFSQCCKCRSKDQIV
jgi:hypothetical protein